MRSDPTPTDLDQALAIARAALETPQVPALATALRDILGRFASTTRDVDARILAWITLDHLNGHVDADALARRIRHLGGARWLH